MSLANSVKITYKGETLALIDQTEVKAVEPYVYIKPKPLNLWKRMCCGVIRFFTGAAPSYDGEAYRETYTKISFKDGTWAKVRMPFYEFVNAYC